MCKIQAFYIIVKKSIECRKWYFQNIIGATIANFVYLGDRSCVCALQRPNKN